MVLNLGDDLDVFPLLSHHLANLADGVSRTDERREHHVDLLLDAESQVLLVLFTHRRQIHVSVRQVAALLRACRSMSFNELSRDM